MYVVEAIPDNARKSLAVVSAYMQKNSGSVAVPELNMLSNSNSPQRTSETPQGAPASTDNSIPASAEKSNPQFKTLNDMVAEKFAPKVRETKYSADARTETASGAGGMPGEAQYSAAGDNSGLKLLTAEDMIRRDNANSPIKVDDASRYTFEALTAKPDMKIVRQQGMITRNTDGKIDRDKLSV